VYEFQRLPFGNTASPFCAQYVLQSHAQSQAEKYPEAADTVENSMYVDDVLDSCETTQEARTLQRQLAVMLSDAGFNLRKWLSNDVEVIEEIPPENRLHGIEIKDENLPTLKALGVLWKPQEDVFTFKVKQPTESNDQEKRAECNCNPQPPAVAGSVYCTSEDDNARNMDCWLRLGRNFTERSESQVERLV
jgi:hypothetical protein